METDLSKYVEETRNYILGERAKALASIPEGWEHIKEGLADASTDMHWLPPFQEFRELYGHNIPVERYYCIIRKVK